MRCTAAALAAARAADATAASARTDEEGFFLLSRSEPEPEPPLARSSASTTSASSAGSGADASRSATPRRISHAARRSGSVKSRYPRYESSSLSSQARAASSHARASARARARSDAETFFAFEKSTSKKSPRATPRRLAEASHCPVVSVAARTSPHVASNQPPVSQYQYHRSTACHQRSCAAPQRCPGPAADPHR